MCQVQCSALSSVPILVNLLLDTLCMVHPRVGVVSFCPLRLPCLGSLLLSPHSFTKPCSDFAVGSIPRVVILFLIKANGGDAKLGLK